MNTTRTGRILLGLLAVGALPAAETSATPNRWERLAAQHQAQAAGITWLTHEPLEFLQRRGDHGDDEAARYARMAEPENIRRMAEVGSRYAMLFFDKGFGLEFERPMMAQSRRIAEEMHRHGMKVNLYIGGTMFTETLYREVPAAEGWEQRNQANRPATYGLQTYRHYACPNEPAYRDYVKRIVKLGVEEGHADQIFFDNIMLPPEPDSCHCPRCLAAFREFLRRRYPTPEAARRRFGVPDVTWLRAPEWSSATQPDSLPAIDDPVLQEWVRFRCESLANATNDLADYVKRLNPNVSVQVNLKGIFSFNRYWTNAVYQPLFAGHFDVMSFDTVGYDARIDEKTGALVSQIRSYKLARGLGVSCNAKVDDELLAAQHMAFGYDTPVAGFAGGAWHAVRWVTSPTLEFFRHYHDRYYTGTRGVADVAVVRNWASMAYSVNATHVPATLIEQVLIQHQVPFDILFEEQLADLDRYGAVILAGQECVSDAQVRLFLDYVRRGGTLVVTGNTGDYNDWREVRGQNPFRPARAEGKGRILYLPQIQRGDEKGDKAAETGDNPEPGANSRQTPRLAPTQWVLPRNHADIARTLTAALPRGLSLRTDAPLTTVAEILTRPASRETLVHLVNFDRAHPVGPVKITVRSPLPGRVTAVTCLSPDTDDPVTLDFTVTADGVTCTVPALRLYAMIVIAHEEAK